MRRDGLEGLEGVGAALRAIAGHLIRDPVAGEEQRPDPRHFRRAEGISDVGLVHDHALDGPEAVIEGVARVVVGPAGGDGVDGLAAGRARAHHLEEMAGLAIPLEIQMREEQVLEQPAPDQRLAGAGRVQQRFPLGHLAGFGGAGLHGLLLDLRPFGQPALQGLVLRLAEAGDGERHAGLGMLAGVGVELAGQGALVLAVDADSQLGRQFGVGHRRIGLAQLQHPRHERGLGAVAVQHRVETLAPPGFRALGIEIEPGGVLGPGAAAIVYGQLARTARGTFGTAQVELARRVVAGMAGHALLREYRLDIAAVGKLVRQGRAGRQHEQDKQGGKQALRHDSIPEVQMDGFYWLAGWERDPAPSRT
ncbi:hypothetical protein D3C85_874660 [compost metagenome]